MEFIETIDELIEVLGDAFDGQGVWLNIEGSQGVSNGEAYVGLANYKDIQELVEAFNDFIDEWCMDYADNYVDDDALAEAEENDDWEEADRLREEAEEDCRADCGDLWLTGDYDNPDSIHIEFTGCEFLRP